MFVLSNMVDTVRLSASTFGYNTHTALIHALNKCVLIWFCVLFGFLQKTGEPRHIGHGTLYLRVRYSTRCRCLFTTWRRRLTHKRFVRKLLVFLLRVQFIFAHAYFAHLSTKFVSAKYVQTHRKDFIYR